MTLSGWENWGMNVYWISVLVIVSVFGLIAYLAEKETGENAATKGKEAWRKSKISMRCQTVPVVPPMVA